MKVREYIDKRFSEIELFVCYQESNEQVKNLVKKLENSVNLNIMGTDFRGDKCKIAIGDVVRFYAEGTKVIAEAKKELYTISYKLYELEAKLDEKHFTRISKSEIVNIQKIVKLDLSYAGTIKVILDNGTETYTSRRNVKKLKEILGR